MVGLKKVVALVVSTFVLLLGASWVSSEACQPMKRVPSAKAAKMKAEKKAKEIGTIAKADLPKEALETLDLIAKGGPFPCRRDGTTFQNREKRLPIHPKGYYKEYTVKTPGAPCGGKKRIVGGSGGELYYTDDHYETFNLIQE